MDKDEKIHDITIAYMSATNAHKMPNGYKTAEEYAETYNRIYSKIAQVIQSTDLKTK